jgi:urease subunit alpha
MSEQDDIALHGARKGDRVRLADTNLWIEVEADDREVGNELLMGFARNARDGIGMKSVSPSESCDLVITNVLIMDPVLGIKVSSIGIRKGRIHAIGNAGNPDMSNNIDVVVGSGTLIVSGEGLIATAGGIDSHVHALAPRVFESALASGITSVIAQELGPYWGVGVGSEWGLKSGYASLDDWPINVGVLGRGAASHPRALAEAISGGVCGFKIHEDTGAHPRTIDTTLNVADEYDVAVALHTDGLNELSSVKDTLAAINGRTVHAYHVEGCGGGHAPNVLQLAGRDNILASSTNPTLAFGSNATAEHVAMIIASHGLHLDVPADIALAQARVREVTMAAENVLHDLGVIPVTSSDALGMGRIGDTWRKTFAMADAFAQSSSDFAQSHDNERVLRYLSKITINPALVHGISHEVGSLQPGLLADIVLWRYDSFATKPHTVFKGGIPAWGVVGDPGSSVPNAQPLQLAEQFGAHGAAPSELSVLFTNSGSELTATARRHVAVRNCRTVQGSDMIRHGELGEVIVRDALSPVEFRGQQLLMDPLTKVSLHRRYIF